MNNPQRSFLPGDTWLYFKIYTGPRTIDHLLINSINPITKVLLEKKIIKKWFFIRYQDPDYHLRLRFELINKKESNKVINILFVEFFNLMNNDLIWNVQIDTYRRELERYGFNTIGLSEWLFYYQSKLIVNYLSLENIETEKLRWLFSIKALDSLLTTFKYNDEEKLRLLFILKNNFQQEFNLSKPAKKQINLKFNADKVSIEKILRPDQKTLDEYRTIYKLIDNYFSETTKVADQILIIKNNNNLLMKLDELLASYSHMLMNRMFRSKNRVYEMVCYDYLFRYYKSKIARQKT